jgi:tRNA(adenine34) deaminase
MKSFHGFIMSMFFRLLMEEALGEARKALLEGEVPVGAILADSHGVIVSKAHNQPISLHDPTAHAEILALRRAGPLCGNYRYEGAILVVTIEPCPMCMAAAIHARIACLVFGARDPKWGAAGSLYDFAKDNRLNHRIEVISGVMEEDCVKLMQDFFQTRRGKNQKNPERYRSGRNGVDSKSTCPVNSGARGFESHPLRQMKSAGR